MGHVTVWEGGDWGEAHDMRPGIAGIPWMETATGPRMCSRFGPGHSCPIHGSESEPPFHGCIKASDCV